jgi:alpha,alpha-trehalose-phosphate synthase [UDP-forming]
MRVSEGIITTGLSDWFATSGSPPRTAPSGQGASGWCGHDLVVVANRLPVHIAPSESVRWRPSPGGLVSALEPVVREIGGVWVGWSGSNHPRTEPFDAGGLHLMPVPLTDRDIAEFYDGFCNATLWPLYHDVIDAPQFHPQWWDSYRRVNDRFAAAAARAAAPGAEVWVHDYQLQLVPARLRAIRPDLRIGLFNHIPFPPHELFAQLPWRRPLIDGMLGADLIGFQRRTDTTNFRRTARRSGLSSSRRTIRIPPPPPGANTASGGARTVRVAAFPISVDFASFDALARRPDIAARARQIRSALADPTIVLLGVDRLDYTKGLLHRLRAYQQLLDRGRLGPPDAVFVQIASPTRDRVPRYQALLHEVEALVGRINADHATLRQPAIRYLHQPQPREEVAALYLAADVLLVTSLRDGMNLVAKEYVACRTENTGALVLSEFTGAADELHDAYLVNPHDIQALQDTILRAVHDSPDEKHRRMQSMRRHVSHHNVQQWARTYLQALHAGTSNSLGAAAARWWVMR